MCMCMWYMRSNVFVVCVSFVCRVFVVVVVVLQKEG